MNDRRINLKAPNASLEEKRRKKTRLKIIIGASLFVSGFVGIVVLSRMQFLAIKDIEVSGNRVVDARQIKEAAERELSGNYLHLFGRKNAFLYPKTGIKEALFNETDRIKEVVVRHDSLRALSISVVERSGEFLWCGKDMTEDDASNCYFIDDRGLIFDRAPYYSGNVFMKFYGGVKIEDPTGVSVLPLDEFKNVVRFAASLEALGYAPSTFSITEKGEYVLTLPKTNIGTLPKLFLKPGFDAESVKANLESALAVDPLKTKIKNYYSSLVYIDLRFENRVFYKFNN